MNLKKNKNKKKLSKDVEKLHISFYICQTMQQSTKHLIVIMLNYIKYGHLIQSMEKST